MNGPGPNILLEDVEKLIKRLEVETPLTIWNECTVILIRIEHQRLLEETRRNGNLFWVILRMLGVK